MVHFGEICSRSPRPRLQHLHIPTSGGHMHGRRFKQFPIGGRAAESFLNGLVELIRLRSPASKTIPFHTSGQGILSLHSS